MNSETKQEWSNASQIVNQNWPEYIHLNNAWGKATGSSIFDLFVWKKNRPPFYRAKHLRRKTLKLDRANIQVLAKLLFSNFMKFCSFTGEPEEVV